MPGDDFCSSVLLTGRPAHKDVPGTTVVNGSMIELLFWFQMLSDTTARLQQDSGMIKAIPFLSCDIVCLMSIAPQ